MDYVAIKQNTGETYRQYFDRLLSHARLHLPKGHSKYSKCHKKWEKFFSMPKNPLKPIYGQYVVGLEPFGTFKSGFGCYHSSILVLRVRKAVKMGNFAYFSFLDYQSSKSLFLWSRCVWMGSYEGDWSTLKP